VSDTVTVKVEGLATIDAALRELPLAVQGEILGDALKAGGEVIKRDIGDRIHSRTGRTVADLRVGVEIKPGELAGRAIIGGQFGKEKGLRGFILNFLERGTKPHVIPKPTKGPRITLTFGGRSITRRGQAPKAKGPMAFGGKVFSKIKHPGIRAQAPMRIAIAESGERAIAAFSRAAWDGIVKFVEKRKAR
jgi:hypothetical protein